MSTGSLEAERDHVSGTAMAEVAAIELRDPGPSYERDRQHCILHALAPECRECRLPYPRARNHEPPHAGRYVYRNPARLRPHSLRAARIRSGARIRGVRLDDLAHQTMADDIRVGEVIKPDPIDTRQNALDLHQARILTRWQIDLGLVAGDHRL